jgi:hypothetical protein
MRARMPNDYWARLRRITEAGLLVLIFAIAMSLGQQPAAPDVQTPKGWRVVREKHGCTFAIPADWRPLGGENMLGTPHREIYVVVMILPRTGPVSDVKQRFSKTHDTVVEETDSRIWLKKPNGPDTALAYVVRQDLPKTNSTCSVLIDIEQPSNLPAYSDVAKQIANSVHGQ